MVVIAGIYQYHRSTTTTTAVRYITGTAANATLITSVSGSGNVVADQTVQVNPSITGTVQNLSVHLGDTVKQGDTLFTIKNDSLDVTVAKAKITLLQAQQAVLTAEAQLQSDQANYTNLQEDAGQAKASASLTQANQAVATAQENLTNDQNTLNAANSGAANYAALQQKVQDDQNALSSAQANLSVANITNDQAKVTASASINAAKQKVATDQIAIQAAQNTVSADQTDLTNQQNTANGRTVTAPISGTITTMNLANGNQLGSSTSSSSSSSSTPMVISDLSALKASVNVNEVDAPSVKVGQKVTMTFDAITGLTLTGKIEKIDTVGTVTSGVVSYPTTIDFDSIDSRVRPGMSMSAEITTSVLQDVLTVPSSAVKSSADGTSYVQIMQNGVPQQVTVQVGASNSTQTQITSGLSSGDSIVTQTITPTSTKTTTTSTSGLNLFGATTGGGGGGRGFTGGTGATGGAARTGTVGN